MVEGENIGKEFPVLPISTSECRFVLALMVKRRQDFMQDIVWVQRPHEQTKAGNFLDRLNTFMLLVEKLVVNTQGLGTFSVPEVMVARPNVMATSLEYQISSPVIILT